MAHWLLGPIVAVGLVLAACGSDGPSPVVDGWPVGDAYACSNPACEPFLRIGVDGLAGRDPGHAAIVDATLHELGVLIGSDGEPVLLVYSGGQPSVVLFRLADGSSRAIGVKYIGVSREASALDWGPGLDYAPPLGR
jgi:hypothetical protein